MGGLHSPECGLFVSPVHRAGVLACCFQSALSLLIARGVEAGCRLRRCLIRSFAPDCMALEDVVHSHRAGRSERSFCCLFSVYA
jgi:hypothetical protein